MKKSNAERAVCIVKALKGADGLDGLNEEHLKVLFESHWRTFSKKDLREAYIVLSRVQHEGLQRPSSFQIELANKIKLAIERAPKRPEPPKGAELLFSVLVEPAHAEAALGDLDERFNKECEELGPARAARRYWGRVLRSLLPLLRRAIGRAAKWGAILATVKRIFVG
jgi:hypothetical protein